jgi:hypothetical protein
MITTEGKNQIKRYLAGYVPYIAGSLGFGIGQTAEQLLDKTLQFEVGRVDITNLTYNFSTNKLIFKGSLPNEFAGVVYEIGLFSPTTGRPAAGSRELTFFNSVLEDWRNLSDLSLSSYSGTNSRVGGDALLHTPLAGATATATLRNLAYDFSYNAAGDKFIFAYANMNTNVSAVTARFLTDSSNYYTFNIFSSSTVGYKIISLTKSQAVATGAPDWSRITEIQVATTATGGQADVEFDGIRIDNPNDYGLDNLLVARKVLTTPVTTTAGQPQEIEYSWDIAL